MSSEVGCYRFTENLRLYVNPNNKTVRIVGSFKHEYLKEAEPIMSEYEGYELIIHDSSDDLGTAK